MSIMLSAYLTESRLSALLKWGLFLLLPLPLYISSSMLFPFITGRNFGFRIIVELLVILWVGLLALSKGYWPRLSWLTKGIILFLFIVTLADILGANPYRSFWSNYERMEGLLALIHMTLFFMLISSVFRKFSDWRLYIYGSTAVSILVACVGLAQKFGLTTSYQGGVRVDGTIGNPAYLASYLMFHVFFLLFLIWRERQAWLRWSAAAAIIFELYIIYLTATRGVILAMAAVTGLLALYLAIRKPMERREAALRRIALAVLMAGAVVIGAFFVFRDSSFVKTNPVLGRFASISAEERTVQSRFLIWRMAWEGVKERPVLGWGQENFYLVFNKYFNPKLWSSEPWFDRSHNVFLDWTIHAGLLGLLAYLAVLFFGVKNVWTAWRGGRVSFYEAGILGGLFGVYFFQNLFVFDNFQSYFLLFLTLGFSDYLAHAETVPVKPVRPDYSLAAARMQNAWIALGTAGAAVLVFLYILNIRPIIASQTLIQALAKYNQGAPVSELQVSFEKSINYGTFGSGEAREQLASLFRSVIGAEDRGGDDEKKKFTEFTIREMRTLTEVPAPDAKHLLFLGSIYNAGLSSNPAYAGEAISVLQRALRLSPAKQPIYFELASTQLALGNADAAMQLMEKAVSLDPAFPNAHLNAAFTAILTQKDDIAEREIAAYRGLVQTLDRATIQRLVEAYLRNNDFAKIKLLLEEGIRTFPESAELYGQYAVALATMGDKEGARRAAMRAGELNPKLKPEVEKFIQELDSAKQP